MTRVRLSEILDGMDVQSDQMTSYLHRPTGRVLWVSEEALGAADEDDENSVEPEELADARAILGGGDEYLALPDRFEIDEYRMMEGFATEIEDSHRRDETLASLRGAKAFRRFKDTVHRLGLSDAWYAFRERAYTDVARTWCEANGIELDSLPSDA
ncbi:MAG: UPF0158 family protein [Gemmatimonadaceae bacterium]|nr:UPF0158 family protein [Gemmatimonadaceae bacterium]